MAPLELPGCRRWSTWRKTTRSTGLLRYSPPAARWAPRSWATRPFAGDDPGARSRPARRGAQECGRHRSAAGQRCAQDHRGTFNAFPDVLDSARKLSPQPQTAGAQEFPVTTLGTMIACPQRAVAVLLYSHKRNDIGLGSLGAHSRRAPRPRHCGFAAGRADGEGGQYRGQASRCRGGVGIGRRRP